MELCTNLNRANVMAVARACVQDGFLPCWQSTFSRLQMGTSGRQKNNTPPSPDQICTSILCPQHGKKNQPKQMPSWSPFPVWCLVPQGKGWWEVFQGHQKQDPFWIYLMEIRFRTGDLPTFVLISRADDFLAVLAYSEI